MFSLISDRINNWVNNRETGDLSRHRGHYDVSVMDIYMYVDVDGDSDDNKTMARHKD